MKKAFLVFVVAFLFATISFGQVPASVDTSTVNGWKFDTNYPIPFGTDAFYMGFSPIHTEGKTSQIFGFKIKYPMPYGYVRVVKTLTTPMPKPRAMDFNSFLLKADPVDYTGNLGWGAIIYLANGDTIVKISGWGITSNNSPMWFYMGFAGEVVNAPISQVERIIFEFAFDQAGIIRGYFAEFLIDHMRFWYKYPDGTYSPTIIDSFEGTITGVNDNDQIPHSFSLGQNYPNPFNPRTMINFQLPISDYVRLVVYDVLGREVVTLVNEEKIPGAYSVTFDGSQLPSGTYFYRLEAGGFIKTKKMQLVK